MYPNNTTSAKEFKLFESVGRGFFFNHEIILVLNRDFVDFFVLGPRITWIDTRLNATADLAEKG